MDYPPTQTYYPRAALHLALRVDEYGAEGALRAATPPKTTKNLNGTTTQRTGLAPQIDPTAPPGVTRYVIAPAGQAASTTSPQQQTSSNDGTTFDIMVIPRRVTWSQNGLRKASQVKATIPYLALPVDPRVMRSIAVELILGCLDYDTAALEADGDWQGQGAPIIPRTYVDANGNTRTNVRFTGFVDSWDANFSDNEPTIEITCTDNTQLLIDQEHSPTLVLDMTKPIDQCIAGYLSNYPQFSGFTVGYYPPGDTVPVLNKVLSGTAYRPNLGPQSSKQGGASGPSKASCWDYITEIVGSIGLSARVIDNNIVIQQIRSILTNSTETRPGDPYVPRTIGDYTYSTRAMIYGRNIKTMKIKRDFRRHPSVNIEMRCFIPEKKQMLVARFPAVSTNPGSSKVQVKPLPGMATASTSTGGTPATPTGTQPDQKWEVHYAAGITDQATLNRVAQGYYEALGRQEFGVEVSTRNLSSFGGGNTDPDILDMRFGDTFRLLVNRSDPTNNSITNIESALTIEGAAQQFLTRLGFPADFAKAIGTAYSNAGFTYAFRMHTMTCNWDCEDGVKIDLTGVNYVEVRADQVLPPGQEPGNTAIPSQQPAPGQSPPGAEVGP